MNFTGRPVSIDIEPASAITLAVKCLEPKLPPVYIGWNSISSGAIFSVPEITQAAKLSMFEFEWTVMRPVDAVERAHRARRAPSATRTPAASAAAA